MRILTLLVQPGLMLQCLYYKAHFKYRNKYQHRYLLRELFIFLLAALLSFSCFSQGKRTIVDIALASNYAQHLHKKDYLNIGLKLTRFNGKISRTTGVAKGFVGWSRLKIKTKNATFNRGKLTYNRSQLWLDNDSITIEVSPVNNPSFVKRIILHPVSIKGVKIIPEVEKANQFHHPSFKVIVELDNGTIMPLTDSLKQQLIKPHFNYVYRDIEDMRIKDSLQITLESPLSVLNKTLKMPVEYDIAKILNFNGVSGERGASGRNARGFDRSGNGKTGCWGDDGNNGGDAGELRVKLRLLVDGVDSLLSMVVDNGKGRMEKLVFSTNSEVSILANGGRGGRGGEGGCGSDGRDETTKTEAGRGGNGGDGGTGGDGGDGGRIVIYADQVSVNFLKKNLSKVIMVKVKGGRGGSGGDGGSKGREGDKGKKKGFLEILFGTRNGTSGSTGKSGASGDDGEFEIVITDEEDV